MYNKFISTADMPIITGTIQTSMRLIEFEKIIELAKENGVKITEEFYNDKFNSLFGEYERIDKSELLDNIRDNLENKQKAEIDEIFKNKLN